MEKFDIEYCPICGAELCEDSEIYIGEGGVVGCENCITVSYPAVIDEDLDEAGKIRWANDQFDMAHEMGELLWQR